MAGDWLSTAELSGLPGLPKTARAVQIRAKRENWQSRSRAGKGGGLEYHLSALPTETRRHLAAQSAREVAVKLPAQPQKAELLARFQLLDERKQQRARARAELLSLWYRWLEDSGQRKAAGTQLFCADLMAGRLRIPDWIVPHMPRRNGRLSLNYATLNRWEKREREQGLFGLADSYGNRFRKSRINAAPELRRIIEALIIEQPHITPLKIRSYLAAEHPQLNLCSERTIARHVERWKQEHGQDYCYLTDPDGWKNKYMTAFGSASEGVQRLNQLWELDATPADWMLTDGRHSMSGLIDVYSRRLRLLVTKTPRAEAHCALLRRAILDWGKPDGIRHDQGQDYIAERMIRVARDLDIERFPCPPFTPEAKPHIERGFWTVAHGLLDLLPGFLGHNVAERRVIEARKSFAARVMTPGTVIEVQLAAGELQQRLDDWTEHCYHQDPHAGLEGRTPADTARSYSGPIQVIGNERALDLLLQEGGRSMVGKKGIRWRKGQYVASELEAWIGQQVEVLTDPVDIGVLYVYGYPPDAATKTFVCIARDPDRSGISRAEVAAVAKARQRKARQAAARAHREASRDLKSVDIADAVIEHRRAQRANVIDLPARTVEHKSNALDQAARAAEAARGYRPIEPDAASRAAKVRLAEDMANLANVSTLPEKPPARYRRWLALDARLEAGDGLDDDEHIWWKSYRTTAEWRAQRRMWEDFGDPGAKEA